MVGELAPAPVDLVAAGREYWERFHEIRRLRHAERRPDEPAQRDPEVEASLKKENPFEFHYWYEISRDGVMLSSFHGSCIKPGDPEYATNKHLFWADAYVRPEQRRNRIGSMWLPVVAELMDRHSATVLNVDGELDPGHAFLTWIGAQPKLTNVESRLRLSDVDWDMLERWVAEGSKRSPQTRLDIYDGRLPEELWPELAPQLSALANTMPRGDLDQGDVVFTVDRMRDWHERMEAAGELQYFALTHEPDGVMSAFTAISWAPHRRRVAHQEFTGVRTDARGRGLGKWVKAANLLHLRQLYPDLESVVTDNAHSNAPMLSINRAIGFRPFRDVVEYQVTRAELERRIRSL